MLHKEAIPNPGWHCTADYSDGELYRYNLFRDWNRPVDGHRVAFIGLNPSTATEEKPDPTVTRCTHFAQDWGYRGMVMLNLFAVRSTDPRGLREVENPIGPDNDKMIRRALTEVDEVILCWGHHGTFKGRQKQFLAKLAKWIRDPLDLPDIRCLGVNQDGTPKHPLYLKRSTLRQPYRIEE